MINNFQIAKAISRLKEISIKIKSVGSAKQTIVVLVLIY